MSYFFGHNTARLTYHRASHHPWSPDVTIEATCKHGTTKASAELSSGFHSTEGREMICEILRQHNRKFDCTCALFLLYRQQQPREEATYGNHFSI